MARWPGDHQTKLRLGGAAAYLEFRYLICDLGRLPAKEYYESTNIVARLNLPNMAYSPADRLEMYRAAQTGLTRLEQNPEKQRKYADFIDFYADLNEDEVGVYRMRYLVGKGEETMGLVSVIKEEGRQEGIQQGVQQGLLVDWKARMPWQMTPWRSRKSCVMIGSELTALISLSCLTGSAQGRRFPQGHNWLTRGFPADIRNTKKCRSPRPWVSAYSVNFGHSGSPPARFYPHIC